jgi:RNase P protein component
VKRTVREAFWDLAGDLPGGSDYVIVARPGVEGLVEREGGSGVRTQLAELLTDEERLS